MEQLFGLILVVIAGIIAFWIVGRFSSDPPTLWESVLGAAISQSVAIILGLLSLPGIISGIVLFALLIKFGRLGAVPAFVGACLYEIIQAGLILGLLLVFKVKLI